MEAEKVPLHSIRKAKVVVDAIFKTALNELVVGLHPGHGVECPATAKKTKLIVTPEQFDAIYLAIEDEMFRLLVETDIESGLRWGELTELRPRDIDLATGMLTVSRRSSPISPWPAPATTPQPVGRWPNWPRRWPEAPASAKPRGSSNGTRTRHTASTCTSSTRRFRGRRKISSKACNSGRFITLPP